MNTLPPALLLTGAALLVGGCASPSPVHAPVAASALSSGYSEFKYTWSDPFFYEPWYDPAAIVLPPPLPGAAASGIRAGSAGMDASGLKEVDYQ